MMFNQFSANTMYLCTCGRVVHGVGGKSSHTRAHKRRKEPCAYTIVRSEKEAKSPKAPGQP